MTIEHNVITAANNHGIVSGLGPYTSAALRQAAVVAAGDVGKVAIQVVSGTTTLWYLQSQTSGVGTWLQINTTADSGAFSGDFGALFTSYGLTVRSYRRGDLGVTGTTGTGKTNWANQLGDGSTMSPGASNASNGIGSVGTGLNGLASVVTNGASQNGQYTHPTSFAPGTTNHHIYAVERLLVGCTASALYVHSANANPQMTMASVGTAEMSFTDGAAPTTTSGVVTNQWYRLRASFTGSASDVVRIGAHAPAAAALGTSTPGTQWGFGSAYNGTSLSQIEALLLMHIEGPLATFLTACADADAKARAFWTTAIEI